MRTILTIEHTQKDTLTDKHMARGEILQICLIVMTQLLRQSAIQLVNGKCFGHRNILYNYFHLNEKLIYQIIRHDLNFINLNCIKNLYSAQ